MNIVGHILIPQIRSVAHFPPLITWINYMTSRGYKIVIIAHKIDKSSFSNQNLIEFIEVTKKPYPNLYLDKFLLKVKSYMFLWKILKTHEFDLIWVCAWDFRLFSKILSLSNFKGKLIYQFLELDQTKFKHFKHVDHIVVPEANRSWIIYFLAKLSERPWVFPNIPLKQQSNKKIILSEIVLDLIAEKKVIIFYSGLIDMEKRCLKEIISAIGLLDSRFHLVMMPGNKIGIALKKELDSCIELNGVSDRVHFINSVQPPHHIQYFSIATVSIGLYKPTSLNQVYAAPNRIYESTAFGIPVILPNYPYFNSLQSTYPLGISTVDPENILDIKNKIELFGDRENVNIGRVNAAKFFEENGNYSAFADDLIDKIFNENE